MARRAGIGNRESSQEEARERDAPGRKGEEPLTDMRDRHTSHKAGSRSVAQKEGSTPRCTANQKANSSRLTSVPGSHFHSAATKPHIARTTARRRQTDGLPETRRVTRGANLCSANTAEWLPFVPLPASGITATRACVALSSKQPAAFDERSGLAVAEPLLSRLQAC